MLKGINERVKKLSEGVFENGSRPGTPEREERIFDSPQEDLLIAVIALWTVVIALILLYIYGYVKYVRGGRWRGKGKMTDVSQQTEDVEQFPIDAPPENHPEAPEITVPVKMRKRSMTFTETDEECRKYREDLADSYDEKPEVVGGSGERSRKKSVVTFAGVEEIEANEAGTSDSKY